MTAALSHKVLGGLVSCKSLSMMSIVTFYPAKELKNDVDWMRNSVFDILCLKYQWDCQGASWLNSSGLRREVLPGNTNLKDRHVSHFHAWVDCHGRVSVE